MSVVPWVVAMVRVRPDAMESGYQKRPAWALHLLRICPTKAKIDGRDLLSVLEGKPIKRALITSITSSFYFKAQPFKIALIEDRSKIMLKVPQKRALSGTLKLSPRGFEFYDLLKDPVESVNLHLRKMRDIERFYPLFENILSKARFILKQEGNKAEIDKNTRDALKSLGYI